MFNRTRLIIAGIVVLVLVVLLFGFGVVGPAARPTPTPTASKAAAPEIVSAEGTVMPARRAIMAFKTSGRVVEIPVKEADAVKAGTLLARLDDKLLKAQVAQAEAAYRAAQTQLARVQASNAAQIQIAQAQWSKVKNGPTGEELALAEAKAQEAAVAFAKAQDTYDRFGWVGGALEANLRGLRDQAGAASATAQAELARARAGARAEEIAVAQAQLDLAQGDAGKAEIRAAQAQVDQAQAALELAKAAARDALIVAPFDGTVSLISVDVGQVVSPNTPAISFGNLSKMQVETNDLAEVDIAKVAIGQTANITVDAFPGKTFQGKVVRVAAAATDRSGKKVFKVVIDLQGGDPPTGSGQAPTTPGGDAGTAGLRWGMTANVDIIIR